jgi:Domain of Unknown Function (DUF928)
MSPLRLRKQPLLLFALQILLSLGVGISLLEIPPALAQTPRIRYKPKTKRPPLTHSEAGGTRSGAEANSLVYLTPLVSDEVSPQTTQARPSFAWYLHNPKGKAVTLEFALIDPGIPKPLYRTTLKTDAKGLIAFQMPGSAPELQKDKAYRWTLIVVNDPKRTGLNQRLKGGILRVFSPPSIPELTAKKPIDQTIAYAEAGIWYDAIQLASQTRLTPDAAEIWLPLLEQGGLKAIADLERSSYSPAN